MCILAISEKAFNGGQELAQVLAKRLRLPYVDTDALVKRAAAGGDEKELRAALDTAPGLFDRFTSYRQSRILLLQAALAEAIRDGNAVCYGIAADLLNLDARVILRVRVASSDRFRCLQAEQRLGLPGKEACKSVRKFDRYERRWHSYLLRAKIESSFRSDLAISLEQTSLYEACKVVLDLVADQGRFTAGAAALASLERFAARTRISAALANDPATSHLDIDVDVRNKTALLRGAVYCLPEIAAIKRVALRVAGSLNVVVRGLPQQTPIFFSDSSTEPSAPLNRSFRALARSWEGWLLGVVVALLVVLAATAAGSRIRHRWFRTGEPQLQSFAGVIADSHCALAYQGVPKSDCVRSCVNQFGAKYVLHTGTDLYVLSDQQREELFAAQRVVATGMLNRSTGALRIRSIRATPLTP